jgi:hypothetical protein
MLLIKGWLLIVLVGDEGLLALDPKRNLKLSIQKEHISPELAEYSEDSWIRMAVWAKCDSVRSGLETIILCTTEGKVKVLPCRRDEGMWVNGIQYC